jgi:hypothetical protein
VFRFFRGSLAFRNVSVNAAVSSEPVGPIEHGHSSAFEDDVAAVFMEVDGFNAGKRLPSCRNGAKQVSDATGLFLRHQIERCFAKHFLRFISEDIEKSWAGVGENCVLIDFPYPIACRFHQGAKPLLAFLQSQFRLFDSLRGGCAMSLFPCWLGSRGRESLPF